MKAVPEREVPRQAALEQVVSRPEALAKAELQQAVAPAPEGVPMAEALCWGWETASASGLRPQPQ